MMEQFYKDYLDRLSDLHNQIETACQGLTTAQLDWTAGNDIPSICVLITHIVGAERFWIADIVAGEHFERDRDAEFKASGCNSQQLGEILAESRRRSATVLEEFTNTDLTHQVISRRDGKLVSVAWGLSHALAHTGIHLGHIQILRQLIAQHHLE